MCLSNPHFSKTTILELNPLQFPTNDEMLALLRQFVEQIGTFITSFHFCGYKLLPILFSVGKGYVRFLGASPNWAEEADFGIAFMLFLTKTTEQPLKNKEKGSRL